MAQEVDIAQSVSNHSKDKEARVTRIESVWRGNSISSEIKDHFEVRLRGSYHLIEMKRYQGSHGKVATSIKTKSCTEVGREKIKG